MTNQSPQEPQNPIPERRTRPATGLTFDEMVAVVVAFTTIGAILFWSLGGRKGGFANNFDLNGDSNLLSANSAATGFGLNNVGLSGSESDLDFAEPESNKEKFNERLSKQKSVAFAPPSQQANLSSKVKQKPYQFDTGTRLAPLAGGVAASSAWINGRNRNGDINNGYNLNLRNTDSEPQASIPDAQDNVNSKPQASIPDARNNVDSKPQASTPDVTPVPDDITPSYWAYPFVKQMSDKALVPDLTGDQNFEPDKLITRAGMATLISQAFDMQPETEKIKKFKDVSNKNAIAADVDKAVRIGFMQGYSNDEFRPLENIPRYQVLVTLATGLGLKPSGDVEKTLQKLENGTDIPKWAKKQVAAAAEAGLIVNRPGFDKNALNPNDSATRGEVAAMIHQALVKTGKLKSLKSEYIFNP